MSIALPEDAVRQRRKTVTRRLGWRHLRVGDQLTLCRKVMGRRGGEPLVRITTVEILDIRREPLHTITPDDVTAEGFPDYTPQQFIDFFCRTHHPCTPDTEITRIHWRYLDPPQPNPTTAAQLD
ncbi:hypothetical protein [Nocardia asiatica]|uniref:hypothetical protein n=1 Tax=Nocardia asiatica TaxID=209252 RepID=UPI0012FC1C4D|nr:hypothetical protein [Nocardia asiatica]